MEDNKSPNSKQRMSIDKYIGVVGDRIYRDYRDAQGDGKTPEPESHFEDFRNRFPNAKLRNQDWDEIWRVFRTLLLLDSDKRKESMNHGHQ